ncbi:kynurenine--oxoglutarate transaminase 3-like [Tropilaelaps mercedesae]|uniref:Kynurenine--oxoglutarate transaminase 3-like n=1 Tax=Tropilaelaps mercedesae TaxID=418985 RepID=A0A1V9XY35_9ACAR|nr:kynurenine--oxoglutarate transaminase 3-like [Tropilaelaps mercedesae]
MNKFAPAERLGRLRPNVWEVFAQLAVENAPVAHLGSGFPDMWPPKFVSKILYESFADPSVHQETDSRGHPRLLQALRSLYSKLIQRNIASDEVLVTLGAYEALYCAFTGLLNPGDEVILIEPYFDCYEAMATMAGAQPVFVTMRPISTPWLTTVFLLFVMLSAQDPDGKWKLDMSELSSAFSSRTKVIVVNTPQNPTGKVFSREELSEIRSLCQTHDIIAVMDEVYEWTVFDGKHVRMASLPDMWDRTITIGSCGKSFAVTGWHIGWAYGPSQLLESLRRVHLLTLNSCPTPMQEAAARAIEAELRLLGHPCSYWCQLPQMLREKSRRLCSILENAGFRVFQPQAGFFVIADFSEFSEQFFELDEPTSVEEPDDLRFCRWLVQRKKILTIPSSAFYSATNALEAKGLLRCCFFKATATLNQVEENLRLSLSSA